MYHVVLTKRAKKGLDKAPDHFRKRYVEALDALQQTFAPVKLFDVKKLKGYEGTYRIRIGDWRILYEFRKAEDAIVVFEIGPRGRIDY